MPEFKYDLHSEVSVLSETDRGISTEVNIISFNEGKRKLDIRKWDKKNDKMLKGIALSKAEALLLYETLKEFDYSLLDDW